jgi:hypothetical protein
MINRKGISSRNSIYLLLLLLSLAGCSNDDDDNSTSPVLEQDITLAYSLILNDGDLLISGSGNTGSAFSTRYWINNDSVDSSTLVNRLKSGTSYRGAVDNKFRQTYFHKSSEKLNQYSLWQGGLGQEQQLSYIKNGIRSSLDSTALGRITAVDITDNEEIFAGWFGEEVETEAGSALMPQLPFYWNSESGFTVPELPESNYFQGISFVNKHENVVYTGGLTGNPMYWKNSEAFILSERFGEIWQVEVNNGNIYAVGFYNKRNSNSAGHTACYWVNGELHELEDNAQAYGILIDGDDIYIAGATGRVPANYKACYWKNGVRMDLP